MKTKLAFDTAFANAKDKVCQESQKYQETRRAFEEASRVRRSLLQDNIKILLGSMGQRANVLAPVWTNWGDTEPYRDYLVQGCNVFFRVTSYRYCLVTFVGLGSHREVTPIELPHLLEVIAEAMIRQDLADEERT